MTLTRLVLAWIPTALWLAIATRVTALLGAALTKPAGQPDGEAGVVALAAIKWPMIEAALLTLFASLWFDSLGSGGWLLLFLLAGALATIPTWRRAHAERPPRRAVLIAACADLARYVVAGAILAWRLG
ncbi:MAG TPA: hypothetical protein VFU41_03760 [Gemmatimonadales bacterium]|nr:hypothetical protein [Gemmatimonadales bacterium]